jgi:hypothetical protein
LEDLHLIDAYFDDAAFEAELAGLPGKYARPREIGYRRMLLDTSVRQVEALTLYERLGFTEIPPYHDVPQELREWLVFRELRLDRKEAGT